MPGVATPDSDRVVVEDAHGWLMLMVAAALILAALAMSLAESRPVIDTDAAHE